MEKEKKKKCDRLQGREGAIKDLGQGMGQRMEKYRWATGKNYRMGTGSQTERDEERQIIALCYRAEREKLKNRDQEPEKKRQRKNKSQ